MNYFFPDAKRENQNRGAHRVRLRRLEQVVSLFIYISIFISCCLFSDGASSSSKSSHDKLEPEVYKTRKDENFTEYFKIHKNQVGIQLMD